MRIVSNVEGTLRDNIDALKTEYFPPNSAASTRGTIAVGEYVVKHGPLIPTTDSCKVYKEASGRTSERRMMSAELYSIISKHAIGHIFKQPEKVVNDKVNDKISHCFKDALRYMDTKRDQDMAIALMERITSVTFVAGRLLHTKNKRAVQTCRDSPMPNLSTFEGIKFTSQ
ncbi:Hypothetical predicted protein, partial [Paramuricea clavata]